MTKPPQKDEIESRRIIERISRETDPSLVHRTLQRAQDHYGAVDADQTDKIDQWGTRIGRGIALLFTIFVIGWALVYLMRA